MKKEVEANIQKNQSKINEHYKLIMFFLLGSFIGCLFETILCYYQRGHFESRRGLIYGPFNPIYGLGAVALVYYLENKKNIFSLFLNGAFLGGLVEYLCSWIQETFFGTTSWNYTNYPLNFDGRTSVYHMLWWGVFSVIFMKLIYPFVLKVIYSIKEEKRKIINIIVLIFFVINGLISGYASIRQEERSRNRKATNVVQKFFDRHYPDSLMERVYPNRKNKKK